MMDRENHTLVHVEDIDHERVGRVTAELASQADHDGERDEESSVHVLKTGADGARRATAKERAPREGRCRTPWAPRFFAAPGPTTSPAPRPSVMRIRNVTSSSLLVLLAACHLPPSAAPAADVRSSAPLPSSSPFVSAVEGSCSKLLVQRAGHASVLVYGGQGVEDRTGDARQSLALIHEGTVRPAPGMLAGLERDARGYVRGDLALGDPAGLRLEVTVRRPASIRGGALFDAAHVDYAWRDGAWGLATSGDGIAEMPPLSTFCVDPRARTLALHASARANDGATWIAGRCEDDLHRAVGGLEVGVYHATGQGAGAWQKLPTLGAKLLEGIVNVAIVAVAGDEAYVHVWAPYEERGPASPYLVHYHRGRVSRVDTPFAEAVVSVARTVSGALWVIVGKSELHRLEDGQWERVSLPPPRFVVPTPLPGELRLLDVRVTADAVWVHGAVAVAEENATARLHVLYTTGAWKGPVFCDRSRSAARALSMPPPAPLTLARAPRRAASDD